MIPAKVYRPAAVVLVASVLVVGAGQAAGAAPVAPSSPVSLSAGTEQQLDQALSSVVTEGNIDTLLAAANEKGDVETVRLLEGTRTALRADLSEKDTLRAASAGQSDLVDIIKRIAKLAQPIVVAALRVGGDGAAKILESIATLVKSIPGIGLGGAITDVVLKSIATGLRVGGAVLADIIESIEIEGASRATARERLTDHLREQEGLRPEAADAWGTVLALATTA